MARNLFDDFLAFTAQSFRVNLSFTKFAVVFIVGAVTTWFTLNTPLETIGIGIMILSLTYLDEFKGVLGFK
jgi:hypothetical protein